MGINKYTQDDAHSPGAGLLRGTTRWRQATSPHLACGSILPDTYCRVYTAPRPPSVRSSDFTDHGWATNGRARLIARRRNCTCRRCLERVGWTVCTSGRIAVTRCDTTVKSHLYEKVDYGHSFFSSNSELTVGRKRFLFRFLFVFSVDQTAVGSVSYLTH